MIPPSLYTHPRPRAYYEPPVANQPRRPVTRPSAEARLRAIRQAKRVEEEVVRDWWPQWNADDGKGSPSHSLEEDRRIVSAAERYNRQTQKHKARKIKNLAYESGNGSSPSSIPPPPEPSILTPWVPGIEYPSLSRCIDSSESTMRRHSPPSSHSPRIFHRDMTLGDPIQSSTTGSLRGSEDASKPSLAPKHRTGHRPSRSHSSSLRQGLSRPSSRQSLIADPATNPVPRARMLSASKLLSFVKRLAPLPRFNPYKRPRAESMSAIVDDQSREKRQVSQRNRRRCKSDSMVPS